MEPIEFHSLLSVLLSISKCDEFTSRDVFHESDTPEPFPATLNSASLTGNVPDWNCGFARAEDALARPFTRPFVVELNCVELLLKITWPPKVMVAVEPLVLESLAWVLCISMLELVPANVTSTLLLNVRTLFTPSRTKPALVMVILSTLRVNV